MSTRNFSVSSGPVPQRRGGVFRKNIDQEKIKWLNIEQFLESEMRCKLFQFRIGDMTGDGTAKVSQF